MTDEWTPEIIAQKLKDNPDLTIDLASEDVRILNMPNIASGLKSDSSNAEDGSLPLKDKFKGGSRRANKYGVAPKDERTYSGVVYHSKKEKLFADDLDLRIKAGDIDFWLRQVSFPLPGRTSYRLDFMTFYLFGIEEVGAKPIRNDLYRVNFYEVKGFETRLGEIKRRQTEELFGITIQVV